MQRARMDKISLVNDLAAQGLYPDNSFLPGVREAPSIMSQPSVIAGRQRTAGR
jgi:hypothetical protein